jgi:hypothetical protein
VDLKEAVKFALFLASMALAMAMLALFILISEMPW